MAFGEVAVTARACRLSLLLLAACCLAVGSEESLQRGSTAVPCPVFVVLGAGGDLAKRFVWKALWNAFSSRPAEPFVVVAAVRGDVSSVLTSLDEGLHCDSAVDRTCSDSQLDAQRRLKWRQCTAACRLAKDSDYKQLLGSTVAAATAACGCQESHRRIYYMAVPPSAYTSLARRIHMFSRPAPGVKLAVALEKPFGRDLSSSRVLSEGLKEWLEEEEVFHVDHYLAKMAVQLILKFRCENRASLTPLFSGQHVERVEVAARESLSVGGRTGYYDRYGAVRDMLQNHLTQLLALAAMDLPRDCSSHAQVQSSKLAFLRSLPNATASSTLLGQYSTYRQEVVDEGGREGSNTATFASTLLEPYTGTWKGSKFVLTSGKALLAKSTYAHIKFSPADVSSGCPREMFFIIYSDHLPAGVIVSEHFKDLKLNGASAEQLPASNSVDSLLSPGCWYGVFLCSNCDEAAYDVIVRSLLTGGDVFVGTDVVTESWRVWDHLVTEIDCQPLAPVRYDSTSLHRLQVTPWAPGKCAAGRGSG